jgi:hypothetical protein
MHNLIWNDKLHTNTNLQYFMFLISNNLAKPRDVMQFACNVYITIFFMIRSSYCKTLYVRVQYPKERHTVSHYVTLTLILKG